MKRRSILIAAVTGALAVVLGAFGAHSLREVLSAEKVATWNTGVEYQFYHTFAILLVVALADTIGARRSLTITYLFLAGMICFSGSIYLLATREATGMDWVLALGPVTPIGGLLFITGWVVMLLSVMKGKGSN
jgi:uncharacterized membrane protein YgdD (TMEM256/DUF423 family)